MKIKDLQTIYIKSVNNKNKEILKNIYPTLKENFSSSGELPSLNFLVNLLNRNYSSASQSSINKEYRHQEGWIIGRDSKEAVFILNYDLIYIGSNKYSAIIVYFVINKKYRNKGLGSQVINQINKEFATKLMPEMKNKQGFKSKFIGSFAEIHDPIKMTKKEINRDYKKNKISSNKRLGFWTKNNFYKINFNYTQIAMPGLKEVKNLSLYFNPYKDYSLKKKDLANHILQFTEFCILDKKQSKSNKTLQNMIKEIELKKELI